MLTLSGGKANSAVMSGPRSLDTHRAKSAGTARTLFLNSKRDGTSYKIKPEGNSSTGTHKSKGNGSIDL